MFIVPSSDPETKAFSNLARIVPVASAISTVAMLVWVLWFCYYGLDLTDESFYLVWMNNPFLYSESVSQFGYIYYPFFDLLDGNIAAIRHANLLIIFGLAWALCMVFLKSLFSHQFLSLSSRVIISGSVASSSFIFLTSWLPTPSYNSLALQALLISAIGLLLADKKMTQSSIGGYFLIGVGVWLAFMAKPSTAAALGLFAGTYLVFSGKLAFQQLAISLATAAGLFACSVWAIDGSLSVFIDRLTAGVKSGNTLHDGSIVSRLVRFGSLPLGVLELVIFVGGVAAIFLSTYFSQAKSKVMANSGNVLSLILACFGLAFIFGVTHPPLPRTQSILLWSILFSAMLIRFMLYGGKNFFQISRSQWILAAIFLVFPYAYALGTTSNYWIAGSRAAIFWVLASLILLNSPNANRNFSTLLLSFGIAVQLVIILLIDAGIESPYRQPHSLRENDYKVTIGRPGSTLLLSTSLATYLVEAIELAHQAGFKKGTPMIDLSGLSPGLLYALGASSIGRAWIIGGYPGSNRALIQTLMGISCEELAKAWILDEPEGQKNISSTVLSGYGANRDTDFEVVGTLIVPKEVGSRNDTATQYLLKPIRSQETAMAACVHSRANP